MPFIHVDIRIVMCIVVGMVFPVASVVYGMRPAAERANGQLRTLPGAISTPAYFSEDLSKRIGR